MATAPGVALGTDVDVAIETLAANNCTLLDVSRCGLGKAGLSLLATPLASNRSVRVLKLEACMITRDCCDVLVDMVLANGRIEKLQLSHNHLGAQGASQLQRLLEQSTGACVYPVTRGTARRGAPTVPATGLVRQAMRVCMCACAHECEIARRRPVSSA